MKDDDQSSFEARHYLAVLWRRKYIILGTVIVIPLLVVGLSLLQHKQYEATARILVEPASSSVSVVLGLNVDTGPPDDRQVPDMAFAFYDQMVVFDNVTKAIVVVAMARLDKPGVTPAQAYQAACRRVDHLVEHYLDDSEAADLDSFRIDGAW